MADASLEKVTAAMGGASRHDAYFLRLFARGMEEIGDPQNITIACATWDQFRQQAVSEGWFTANGPEAASGNAAFSRMCRSCQSKSLVTTA